MLVDHATLVHAGPLETRATLHHGLGEQKCLVEAHRTKVNGHEHCSDLRLLDRVVVRVTHRSDKEVDLVFAQLLTVALFHDQIRYTIGRALLLLLLLLLQRHFVACLMLQHGCGFIMP